MSFELTIAEGKGRGQRFQFDAADVTIGRGSENDMVLNDAGVSRNHARIQRAGQGYQLLDNGSANGTELNGIVIAKPTLLRDGDRIGVGPIVFRFDGVRAQAAALPPLPSAGQAGDETRITAAPSGGRSEETRVSSMPVQGAARAVAPQAGGAMSRGGATSAYQGLGAWFASLPAKARLGIMGAGALLLLLIVVAWAKGQKPQGPICPEFVDASDDPSKSYGRGVVDFECGEKVQFRFVVPTKTTAFFHFEASHVGAPNELELKINGKHLFSAPPAGAQAVASIVTIPDELLSPDQKNVVTFIEAQKGKEWAVSKVRIELLAITPGDLRAGQAAYERGRRKLEERNVSPRNLYDAWKYFVDARRLLEGLNPKPPLYGEVAQLIKDSERELDKECGRLMFTASKQENYGQEDKAQLTYREILRHFPDKDPSGCRKQAQDNIVSTPPSGG